MSQTPIKKPAKQPSGLSRSASLLKALGPNAASVWAELDPADADAITGAMANLPDGGAHTDTDTTQAATALINQAASNASQQSTVWARMSDLKVEALAAMITDEHPQVIALTLSRITPAAAATLVRRFPAILARDVLHRMLHMAPAQPAAIAAIERSFAARLPDTHIASQAQPAQTLARIFDALPSEDSQSLLSSLGQTEPDASERVRALMFSFADLQNLSPAGMQTLLSRADRALLTLALKGVDGALGDAFYNNMTARARAVLQEEIAALGPRPRSQVEAARTELVTLTRALIDTGDIRAAGPDTDEDLIA